MQRMCLGVVVGTIFFSTFPEYVELFLGLPAFQPVHSLIIGFCSFWGHGAVNEPLCRGIICDGSGGRLGVPHFLKCPSQGNSVFTIVVQGGHLCLSCGSHNMFDDLGEGEDGPVVEVFLVSVGQVKVTPGPALSVWFRLVRPIGVQGQDHIAGVVSHHGVWMGGTVVQEMRDFVSQLLRCVCLSAGYGAQRLLYGGVHPLA